VITEVVVPMLGITVEKGTIVEWLKKEGDSVKKGEIIFIVETEKVTTEVESPASGVLAKIIVPVGIEVPVLTLVGVITDAGEELPAKYSSQGIEEPRGKKEIIGESEHLAVSAKPKQALPSSVESFKAVPAARKLAQNNGIDLKTLAGSGPGGIILVQDVELALKSKTKSPLKTSILARKLAEKEGISLEGIKGSGVRGRIMRDDIRQVKDEKESYGLGKVIKMSSMRKTIARRMAESAVNAPHTYFFTDVFMAPLLDYRHDILAEFEKRYKLRPSVNDFLIKAVALNILEFPILNSTIKGDEIHILPDINVCLAVALPDGLIVPTISNADKAGLADIIRQREDLVQRAKSGKLSMEELESGTFTISSLTQYDINYFTAILNPPQSGILTVGKTRDELAMDDKEVKVKKICTLGLSVDHRIIDGAVAADFLQNLKWKLERPSFLFLKI